MTYQLLAETAASVSELKANPMRVVALNGNEPAFYCVPARAYEALMELIDDAQLLKLVKERQAEPSIRVKLDEL